MARAESDRNLLFGVLALQMDFISRDALIAAMNAWALEKNRSLGHVLVDRGDLHLDDFALLDPLVAKHIERHGDDPERSLESLSSVSWLRQRLQGIADPELNASVARLGADTTRSTDPWATVAPSIGDLTSSARRFRILRPHASGGLGEVFVARDAELNREVALKQIKDSHADHPESRSRFLLEAEVTGGLEHPGIVPVYGLGHYADGRPFYAMRFIRGDSLREAIDRFHRDDRKPGRDPGERALALRQLLRRYVDVCNAVAYAHSRGVLHRDLKPGNVMLGPYGETLVVDWGLAKPMGRSEGIGPAIEGTLRPSSGSGVTPTQVGSAIGTPTYMSPEQAAGRLDELGPASDVYSLGAMLYHLLAGRVPFEGSDLGEILRKVRAGDFPPARQVNRSVPPALEAVCVKAMAREPGARYASPRALADEIEHWLADEPVSAWREPFSIRATRWMRRHRVAVAGAAAMLVTAMAALTGGFIVVSLQKQETQRQSLRAEANFQKAVEAVERLLVRVGNERLRDVPQMERLRAELLEDALQFQRGFLADRGDDPGTRLAMARVALMAGDLQRQLNRLEEAERSCRQALAVADDLVARSPREPRYRGERATALDALGLVLDTLGRSDEAMAAYRRSIDVRAPLVGQDPDSVEDRRRMAVCLDHLGVLLHGAGHLEEAESSLVRGRQICEAAPSTAPADPRVRRVLSAILGHLGRVVRDRGRRPEALELHARAVAVQRALVAAAPHSSDDRELLIVALGSQANELVDADQTRLAERIHAEAVEMALRLKDEYPGIPRYRQLAAINLVNLANGFRRDPARRAEARRPLEQAIDIQEGIVSMSPTLPEPLSKLAQMYDALANLLRAQGALDEAESAYRKELSYQSRLTREHPQLTDYGFGHGQVLHNLADLLRERGRQEEALPFQRQAADRLDRLHRSNPRNPHFRQGYSYACWTLAQILVDLKDHRGASDVVAEYLRIEPYRFEESFESAGFLCQCANLCRHDSSIPEPERQALARTYSDRALDALGTAVRNGFRDARILETADAYVPIRDREDFRRLKAELWDRDFPADPFAP